MNHFQLGPQSFPEIYYPSLTNALSFSTQVFSWSSMTLPPSFHSTNDLILLDKDYKDKDQKEINYQLSNY